MQVSVLPSVVAASAMAAKSLTENTGVEVTYQIYVFDV